MSTGPFLRAAAIGATITVAALAAADALDRWLADR